MLVSRATHDDLTAYYTTAVDALCAIAGAHYYRGRLSDARSLLRTTLTLLEAPEATAPQRLKALLLCGRVLVVEHLLTRGEDAQPALSTVRRAKEVAESAHDEQGIADATSLLGMAHYFASVAESRRRGEAPTGAPGDGRYDQALAYQRQALELREALKDTRGVSESCFLVGVVYERWGQYSEAREFYAKARAIADRYGYTLEKAEPARHCAAHALRRGDLDQALTFAKEALAFREKAGFRPYLPFDHLLLRDIYLAKGDAASAQRHTQEASALAEEMGLRSLVASASNIRDALSPPRAQAAR